MTAAPGRTARAAQKMCLQRTRRTKTSATSNAITATKWATTGQIAGPKEATKKDNARPGATIATIAKNAAIATIAAAIATIATTETTTTAITTIAIATKTAIATTTTQMQQAPTSKHGPPSRRLTMKTLTIFLRWPTKPFSKPSPRQQ